ncbi:hypothetical protein FQZ97_691410 [compost metagenome]
MRVPHGHGDRGVSEDPLQAENVPTAHSVMTSEGVPEDMGHLAWGVETTALVGTPECSPTGHEQATVPGHPNLERNCLHLGRDGHRPGLAILGPVEVRLTAKDRAALQ